MNHSLKQHGIELIAGVLSAPEVEMLRHETARLTGQHRGGARDLFSRSALIRDLASREDIRAIADEALASRAFPVRALFFDKTDDANWKVPWHQDTAIAVSRRTDIPGFYGWSEKDGIPHVHPPAEILAEMISLRLHLDDCGPENGPLRVIPGSHQSGVLDTARIASFRDEQPEIICTASAGDVLAMRPLLLHASSAAQTPAHRRVIHIEYACQPLPAGLQWYEESRRTSDLN